MRFHTLIGLPMELKHLEQIVTICRAGGLSEAARRLRISQPSLSKSIAKLEAQLGVSLFSRSEGRSTPTVYGQYIADRSESVLTSVAAITLELQQMVRGEAGKLRIGSGPASRIRFLPVVLDAISNEFPTLQVEARFIDLPSTLRALRAGRLDIAFCTSEAIQIHEDFIRIKVFNDRNIAAVRPDHPALTGKALSPSELLKYPMASSGLIPSFGSWVDGCSPAEIANLKAFLSDDYNLIKARAQKTDIVARGPHFVFESELRNRELIELSTTWQSQYECWMLTTRALWQSPVIKSVADIAKRVGRQIVASPKATR